MGSPKTDDQNQSSSNGQDGLIAALLRELRENSVALASYSAEQRILRDRVERLSKILKEDEGAESLMTRLSILENSVNGLKKDAEKTEHKIDKINDTSQTFIIEERKDLRETTRQKWALYSAVAVALIGAIVSICLAIYGHK